jgi:hypothetical protein
MGFNSAFKGLSTRETSFYLHEVGYGTSLNHEEWMARMKEGREKGRKEGRKT